MSNHYITKETKDRLYSLMREKGVTSSDLCKVLNVAYPDLRATFDGKSPLYNKWQKKIAEALRIDKDDLFKEVNNRAMTSGNLDFVRDLEKKWESTVRADERAKTLKQVMPILLKIVDEEGCCYGFEKEICDLENEYNRTIGKGAGQ